MYSFMENYNGYNQVKMVEEDKVKPAFILEWGPYPYNVLSFGLCNVFATFQEVFKWLYASILDNFNVYGNKGDHIYQLQKCL
jgi:hypothetical protein